MYARPLLRFLVSDRVYVSSIPAKSKANPNPVQSVFSSSSDDSEFEIYPDPRGNTLGRGTEITLILKNDASEYLNTDRLRDLVYALSCLHLNSFHLHAHDMMTKYPTVRNTLPSQPRTQSTFMSSTPRKFPMKRPRLPKPPNPTPLRLPPNRPQRRQTPTTMRAS